MLSKNSVYVMCHKLLMVGLYFKQLKAQCNWMKYVLIWFLTGENFGVN